MDFDSFAAEPKGDSGSKFKWGEDTIGFLTACRDAKVRITYGGLSLLKKPEGNFNRGRHGSNVVKTLPTEVQPLVCRTNGTYHEKAQAAFDGIDGFSAEDGPWTATKGEGDDAVTLTGHDAIATWKVIDAGNVEKALESYKAEQAEESAE